jgi:transposase-like protein
MIGFKGRHFPKDLILMAVRWKIAHPLSYRAIEELMEERGANLGMVQKVRFLVNTRREKSGSVENN